MIENLATAGAFGCFDVSRREALWAAGAVVQSRPERLAGVVTGVHAPQLPGMDEREIAHADLWSTGVAPDGHPTRFVRPDLDRIGVVTATGLARVDPGQPGAGGWGGHPPPASGDCRGHHLRQPGGRDRPDQRGGVQGVLGPLPPARPGRPALLVRGRLETAEGVVNVVAETISLLPLGATVASRDFR